MSLTMTRVALRLLLLAAATALLSSCAETPIRSIDRTDLFSLDIGRSENEVDLFQLERFPMSRKTELYMRDGVIYISNGPANKVMEFTSYGDLVSLVYNARENPEPVLLQSNASDKTISNRRAFSYAFNQVGEIAVTSERTLLVEDRLTDERSMRDEELGVSLNRSVLRFDANGQLLDYLGQEGIGGTPFPFIEDLHVTGRDEIVVVSRTEDTWLIFWYNSDGDPLYNVEIPRARLPIPEGEDVIPVLEKIVPDRRAAKLYLKLNYYKQSIDEQTGAAYGIDVLESRVYTLDLNSGAYESFVTVPKNVQDPPAGQLFSDEKIEYLYEFIGTAPGEHLYFVSRESERRSQLLIMNTEGRVLKRRYLQLDDSEIVYQKMHVSPQGIVTALLASEKQVELVWWRTDRLIEDASG
jgi:hypothetical protein